MKLFKQLRQPLAHLGLAAALCVTCLGPLPAQAQSLSMLQEELIQRDNSNPERVRMAFWTPVEYFMLSSPNDVQGSKMLAETLRGYTMMLVLNADKSGVVIKPRPSEETLRNCSLQINDGPLLKPVADKDLSEDLRMLKGLLRPIFKNIIGDVGASFEFVLFRTADTKGNTNVDILKPGKLRLLTSGSSYEFKTPLAGAMPTMIDAQTGEEFPGTFRFSPFTGTVLKPKNSK